MLATCYTKEFHLLIRIYRRRSGKTNFAAISRANSPTTSFTCRNIQIMSSTTAANYIESVHGAQSRLTHKWHLKNVCVSSASNLKSPTRGLVFTDSSNHALVAHKRNIPSILNRWVFKTNFRPTFHYYFWKLFEPFSWSYSIKHFPTHDFLSPLIINSPTN